jgi:tetratricopeptide (TPR) repeat protein
MRPRQRASELHGSRKLATSERFIDSTPTIVPRGFDALHQQGVTHFRAGRFDQALSFLRLAVQTRPSNRVALVNLARVQAILGQRLEAVENFDRALALDPNFAEAHLSRGQALLEIGRCEDARLACAAAAALRPRDAQAFLWLGTALRELERLPDALDAFLQALAINPDYPEALVSKGAILREMGRPVDALPPLDRALALNPGYALAHSNRANALNDLKRFEEALTAAQRAISLEAKLVEAWIGCGNALRGLRRFVEALSADERALELRPNGPAVLSNRGATLFNLQLYDRALEALDAALAVQPSSVAALCNRAMALDALDRPIEALADCDRAIALKPDDAAAHGAKGTILIGLGRIDEGVASIETAIRCRPTPRLYGQLAFAKRMRRDDSLAAMQALAERDDALPLDERADLHFALGKAHDDLGEWETAFRHYLAGNAARRARRPYDEAATMARFDAIEASFTPDVLRAHAGEGQHSAKPVFIVGMPRSGTSLAEQILASHSKVYGAGERDDFEREAARLARPSGSGRGGGAPYDVVANGLLRELGGAYLARLETNAPAACRITDKMPLNFRFVGLIHLALPNARIIHMRRDPADTCLSCFFHQFDGDLNWAYDLAEVGRYFRAYERIMAHWRAALPEGVMLEMRYEDLVADLEGQARRMLAHCGLEWEERCLDFHHAERSVRTASAVQVRKPIYKSSVERWRAYEPWLQPLIAELQPSMEAYAQGFSISHEPVPAPLTAP